MSYLRNVLYKTILSKPVVSFSVVLATMTMKMQRLQHQDEAPQLPLGPAEPRLPNRPSGLEVDAAVAKHLSWQRNRYWHNPVSRKLEVQ